MKKVLFDLDGFKRITGSAPQNGGDVYLSEKSLGGDKV
jgi:hypothetical protein